MLNLYDPMHRTATAMQTGESARGAARTEMDRRTPSTTDQLFFLLENLSGPDHRRDDSGWHPISETRAL